MAPDSRTISSRDRRPSTSSSAAFASSDTSMFATASGASGPSRKIARGVSILSVICFHSSIWRSASIMRLEVLSETRESDSSKVTRRSGLTPKRNSKRPFSRRKTSKNSSRNCWRITASMSSSPHAPSSTSVRPRIFPESACTLSALSSCAAEMRRVRTSASPIRVARLPGMMSWASPFER